MSTQLYSIDTWKSRLGLMAVPLFPSGTGDRYVLLNGAKGNLCLDLAPGSHESNARSLSWSADVDHYVSVWCDRAEVRVQQWDDVAHWQAYTAGSVLSRLEAFHSYLGTHAASNELSIVSHFMRVFRSLRAIPEMQSDGLTAIRAFLVMLACAADHIEIAGLDKETWDVPIEACAAAEKIPPGQWNALVGQLSDGIPSYDLQPDYSVFLRHGCGRPFQEAHYEVQSGASSQLLLAGFAPAPARLSERHQGIGIHFTPSVLARTVVEEALRALGTPIQSKEHLRIFDPACGSGEFLVEATRQLRLQGYAGTLEAIGWDLSPSAREIANFRLARASREAEFTYLVETRDSLSSDPWPGDIDLLLMNPPFVSWDHMTSDERDVVKANLGAAAERKPDMALAFAGKANSVLPAGAVLGAVLPASFLDGRSAQRLRQQFAQAQRPTLVARLGSQSLFARALVDTCLYISRKQHTGGVPMALWSDYRSESTWSSLRRLRRMRLLAEDHSVPVDEPGYSIYPWRPSEPSEANWSPRPYHSFQLLSRLGDMTSVADLFDVRQGARTSGKKEVLLSSEQYAGLPQSEHAYFRPAIDRGDIIAGFILSSHFVFYPYGEFEIPSEEQLRSKVPVYFEEYLLPRLKRLESKEKPVSGRWWQLQNHRVWQVQPLPKLVSAYFGDAGSFGWDRTGKLVVVNGLAWLPTSRVARDYSERTALCYLSILSSPLFSTLLSARSNQVSGGQWNLSRPFVSTIPLPDLMSEGRNPQLIAELSRLGRLITAGDDYDHESLETATRAAYGLE